jgi:hypothetical protein
MQTVAGHFHQGHIPPVCVQRIVVIVSVLTKASVGCEAELEVRTSRASRHIHGRLAMNCTHWIFIVSRAG